MSTNKAAEHTGHLQELLVVMPIVSMSRLVLSDSDYY